MLLPPVITVGDEDEGVEDEELEDDWPELDLFPLVFFANNSTCVWEITITEMMSATATNTVSRLVLAAIRLLRIKRRILLSIFFLSIYPFSNLSLEHYNRTWNHSKKYYGNNVYVNKKNISQQKSQLKKESDVDFIWADVWKLVIHGRWLRKCRQLWCWTPCYAWWYIFVSRLSIVECD